jgi:hypothetical protein
VTLDRKATQNGGRTGNGWPGEAPSTDVDDVADGADGADGANVVTDVTDGSRSGVRSG